MLAYKRDIFYHKTILENKCRARIGDIVLIKEESLSGINWRKGKINKLVFGYVWLARGVELLVYQSKKEKILTRERPVQLLIPFELCDPNEPTETHTDSNLPKRLKAKNADAIRRASDH